MSTGRYNVRVAFNHGNSLALDLKACGTLYIEPGKDYFFSNAPMEFIDYLAQLKRLGITYRITENKKGCYRTIDLTEYDAFNSLKAMSNFRNTYKPRTNVAPIKIEEVTDVEVPDLIPDGTFKDPVEEIDLKLSNTGSSEGETPKDENSNESDKNTDDKSTEGASEEPEAGKGTEDEPVDYESMNKKDLIEYAHSLGLNHIEEIYTKKEIYKEIEALNTDK